MKKHLLTAILCGVAFALQAQTDTWTADQLFPESSTSVYTPGTGNEFGWDLAATPGVVVAGSLNEEAVVYIRNQSTQDLETTAVLTATDGGFFDSYGGTVAAAGNVVGVGAPLHNSIGAVYTYSESSMVYTFQQKIEPTDGTGSDQFGRAMAMKDGKMLIGAPGHDSGKGAVYYYELFGNVWGLVDKFVPADAQPGDQFGTAVAMAADTYLATSPNHFLGGGINGAAYTFKNDGGTLTMEEKLVPVDGVLNDNFGEACAMTEMYILVAATSSTLPGTDAGAVHAWIKNGTDWEQILSIYPENPTSFEFFGRSLSINGEDAVIGSPGKNSGAGEATTVKMRGAISLKTGTVTATNSEAGDSFGEGAVMLNNRMAISANYGSSDVNDSGIFETYDWDCPEVDTSITITPNGVYRANYFSASASYQWFKYNPNHFPEPSYMAIPGATGREYTPLDPGWYYVVIEQDGCIYSSYVYDIWNVSVPEYAGPTARAVPNPSYSGDVMLVFDQNIEDGVVTVIDAIGQKVQEVELKNSDKVLIELNRASGLYFAQLQSEFGTSKPVRLIRK